MGSQINKQDAHLVGRTLRGDTRAFRDLIERYRNVVFGLAVSYVSDFDRAEDLAQEAFIKAYYSLTDLRDWHRFGPWIRTIAANLCRMELRKTDSAVSFADQVPAPETERPDRQVERREIGDAVLEALARLPEGQRQVLVLYYLEEMNMRPIARFLEITEGAAKVRLHRARKALREEMVQMTKQKLSDEKPGEDFAERIDLIEFGALVDLSDDEMRTVLDSIQENDFQVLWQALASDDPETRTVRERLLEVLDVESREHLEVNIRYSHSVNEPRRRMLDIARLLQEEGKIRPSKPSVNAPPLDGTVSVTDFDAIVGLADQEIQALFREVETVDLAAAMDEGNQAEIVNSRIKANVSDRVWEHMQLERKHHPPSDERQLEVRRGIIDLVRKLQEDSGIRPAP